MAISQMQRRVEVKLNSVTTDLRIQQNNFDLLRFIFASMVFLVHAHILSGAPGLSILGDVLSSEIAVKSFFVVSGFLIFMSFENSRSLGSYFTKRIRRIYPAYFVVTTGTVLLWALFGDVRIDQIFSFQTLKYAVANLVFMNFFQHDLPGLFANNPLHAVNGALWTLKIEVMFYVCVPLIVLASQRFGRIVTFLALYGLSVGYNVLLENLATNTGAGMYLELQRQLPGQLTFFITGASAYYFFPLFKHYAGLLVGLSIIAFMLRPYLPWSLVEPAALGTLVIFFACAVPYLGNFGKYGDLSYGIYIIHFPLLQTLISYGGFSKYPWTTLFFATTGVIALAFMSWHFVEKPFLRKSSHYVVVEKSS
jgi:peptidoglycan/LPS O-acetylase OafA/YrhL